MSLVDLMDPTIVHENLCRLAKTSAEMDYEIGCWLAAAHRLAIHEALGHASFGAYVEWLFGFSRRQGTEHLRVALALEELPLLAEALRTGALSWSAARELSRVAVEETEAEWIEAAAGKTMRGVERMVARHRKGARPMDRPTAEAPKRITLEVSAPTWALFEEMRKAVTAELGGHASDDALVATLSRAVLGGGTRDEGAAAYQIAMTICESCRTTTQRAGGDEVVVDEATVLAQVLEVLVGMGWKQREAQGMVDRAKAHVGAETRVEDAIRLALQQAPARTASQVREALASYARLAA
jgi:hypothetical protein